MHKKIIFLIAIKLFAMEEIITNEKSSFGVKSTYVFSKKIKDGFLEIDLKKVSIRLDKKYKYEEKNILYIQVGTAQITEKNHWNIEIYSNKININKKINEKETLIIKNKKLYIPIESIKNKLEKYWLTFLVASNNEKQKVIGFCYTHDKKKLTK